LSWGTPELPVEGRREVFVRPAEQVGKQLAAQGISEAERWTISLRPARRR
jgi:hypothetical protein